MSLTKIPAIDKVTVTRTHLDGSSGQGCGGSKHLYVGRRKLSGTDWAFQSYIRFVFDWDGVGQIKSFVVSLFTDDGSAVDGGTGLFPLPHDSDTPKIKVRRLQPGASFTDGNNVDGTFNASDYTNPNTIPDSEVVKVMRKDANELARIDLTAYANHWAPKTVKQSNGAAGSHQTNQGLALLPMNLADETKSWSGWSDKAPTPGFRIVAELIYEPGLTNPNVPTNLSPTGVIGVLENFEGDFGDIRPAATIQRAGVQIYAAGATVSGQTVTGTLVKEYSHVCSSVEIINVRASVPPTDFKPTMGANYKWRMRHQNEQGRWGNWTGLATVNVTNTVPTAPTLAPDGSTYPSLAGVLFRGTAFADTDHDKLLAYRVQLSSLNEGDPLWDDPVSIYWDTGKRLVETGAVGFSTTYGGRSLLSGDYVWRAMWWDSREGESDWAYAAITLANDFDQDPGSIDIPIFNPNAPWRVVIYDMGEDRGPGNIVAVVTKPKSIGASVMYNAPGELHFTLSVDDPQAPVIEPRQTHYAVQFYSADGWRDIYNGLIWDFDATDTDVIFYGIDYLGLFDQLVDTRFDPDKPDKGYTHGGSKYNSVTISGIVADQLDRAIDVANSPVGFMVRGTIETMDESVTIWSTFTTCLQFVVGLIDSHKQGSGLRTRVKVYYDTVANKWKVGVENDAGTTRDNLRLRYGELVQGYRVVPFGPAWSSVSNIIGRNLNSAQVFYQSSSSPGIDPAVWGRFDSVQILNNIDDDNDLKRRAKQLAVHAGKLGKQVGLGIRSGLLLPRNGYDVCDVLPVQIQHGVVDTDRFGSGYWVIYGIAWEGGDDGSSTVILTLQPQEDSVAPDPDLIPSSPISTTSEWQIGWVPPDPLAGVNSKYYLDQSTGKVYQRDATGVTPTYAEIVPVNPVPPQMPTGLALDTVLVPDTLGHSAPSLIVSIDPASDYATRTTWVKINTTTAVALLYDEGDLYDDGLFYDSGVDLAGPTLLVPIDRALTQSIIARVPDGASIFAQAYATDVYGVPSESTSVVTIVALVGT